MAHLLLEVVNFLSLEVFKEWPENYMAEMFERISLLEKMALKVPSIPGISVIYVFFIDF